MEKINRRKFLKTAGKLTLAGTAAFSIVPAISNLVANPLKLAFASETQTEFDVYNDVNPNARDIVAYTFNDCLAKKWWPGIFYKTSKPMVAVAGGTVTQIMKMEEVPSEHAWLALKNEPNTAKGFLVKISHGTGYESFYLHLKKPEVKSLQKSKGDKLLDVLMRDGIFRGLYLRMAI